MALNAFGAFDPARQRQPHPGQLRSSKRKRYAQAARRAAILVEAYDRGVDPLKIIQERQGEVDRVVATAALIQKREAEKRREAEKSSQWGGGW